MPSFPDFQISKSPGSETSKFPYPKLLASTNSGHLGTKAYIQNIGWPRLRIHRWGPNKTREKASDVFFWVRCLQNKRGFAKRTMSFSWAPSPHHNVEQRRSTERLATNPRSFYSTLHSLISDLLSTLWWGDGGCAMMRILKPTFILQTPVPWKSGKI